MRNSPRAAKSRLLFLHSSWMEKNISRCLTLSFDSRTTSLLEKQSVYLVHARAECKTIVTNARITVLWPWRGGIHSISWHFHWGLTFSSLFRFIWPPAQGVNFKLKGHTEKIVLFIFYLPFVISQVSSSGRWKNKCPAHERQILHWTYIVACLLCLRCEKVEVEGITTKLAREAKKEEKPC